MQFIPGARHAYFVLVAGSVLSLPTAVQAQTSEPNGTIIYRANAQVQPTPAATPTPEPERKPWLKRQTEKFADRLQLGARAGYAQTFSSKTREKFGEGDFSIRPTFFRLGIPKKRQEFGPDFNYDSRKKNDNKLRIFSAGVEYRYNFNYLEVPPGTTDKEARKNPNLSSYPYLGAGLGVTYGKVRVPDEGLDTDYEWGLGGTLTAGYQYKTRLRLEATITGLTSIGGYNFSGGKIGLNYKM